MTTLEQRKEKLRQYKTPTTKDNYLGIELEFSCPMPQEDLMLLLIKDNLDKYISVGRDGGAWEGELRNEWRILVKQKDTHTVLKAIAQLIAEAGGRFHPRSGFHVHIDMRNRNKYKVFKNFVNVQDILFTMSDKSRKNNKFCTRMFSDNIDHIHRSHYHAINPVLETAKNTIEIRIRESTTDWKDIYYWTSFLCCIADGPILTHSLYTAEQATKELMLPKHISEYVSSKMKGKKS